MRLSRKITGFVNWGLDNLLPPLIRDSKLFMSPVLCVLFGRKAQSFLEFKERVPFLAPGEIDEYYAKLADVHIERDTDLTPAVMSKVLDNVIGETVLDVGCGQGTLSQQIAMRLDKRVVGVDIHPPESRDPGEGVEFSAGRVEQIDCPDKAFDTVVCTHTLEHAVDIERAVSELRRVARRRLIIVVPRQRNYRITFDLHLHFFPYLHSLQLAMRNPGGEAVLIGNDIYYQEDLA